MKRYQSRLRQFHGHLGPYVVLGYRMGTYARSRLGRPEAVSASCPTEPPVSCLLDGLQLSTGCTLGRGSLQVSSHAFFRRAVFRKGRKRMVVSFTPDLARSLKSPGRRSLQYVVRTPLKKLFVIRNET